MTGPKFYNGRGDGWRDRIEDRTMDEDGSMIEGEVKEEERSLLRSGRFASPTREPRFDSRRYEHTAVDVAFSMFNKPRRF